MKCINIQNSRVVSNLKEVKNGDLMEPVATCEQVVRKSSLMVKIS